MFKKYSFYFLIALLIGGVFSACKKDEKMVSATIVNSGDITLYGCGYLMLLQDNSYVKPTYLPAAYQHDGVEVRVAYHHTGVFDTCNFGPKVYDLIKIDEIEQVR